MRSARTAAKQGDLFTAVLAGHIREVIKSETKQKEKQEVRETVLESEVKAGPLSVDLEVSPVAGPQAERR